MKRRKASRSCKRCGRAIRRAEDKGVEYCSMECSQAGTPTGTYAHPGWDRFWYRCVKLTHIGDVQLKCELCGAVNRVSDCEPDADGEGSLGCPLPDCGGIMKEIKRERGEQP